MKTKKKDALTRAGEFFLMPINSLPKLAVSYWRLLERLYGGCGDVAITAFAHYAQLEEHLPCSDRNYRPKKKDKELFAKVKAEL